MLLYRPLNCISTNKTSYYTALQTFLHTFSAVMFSCFLILVSVISLQNCQRFILITTLDVLQRL